MINIHAAKALHTAYTEAVNGNVVDEDEIKRRADICTQCPLRRRFRFTPAALVSKMLALRANKHRVPTALSKYKCKACGCSLMMLLPAKTLHPDSPSEAKVRSEEGRNCWVPDAVRNTD